MRQTLSKGMVVAAAVTGVLSLYGGSALADSQAQGAAQSSPGVRSESVVETPANVPGTAASPGAQGHDDSEPRVGYGDSSASPSGGPTDSGNGGSKDPGYGGPAVSGGHGDQLGPDTDHSAPPAKSDDTTLPLYGGEETTPPPYGGEETTRPPYGGEETTRPPYGGEETTPPGGDHSTPPGGGHTTPPIGGGETTPPGTGHTPPPSGGGERPEQPPMLPHTGGDSRTMMATSAASAVLIAVGAVLYRRGRSARRR
ncbi:chaplin family protein [Streptomyces sp. NPDC088810]|uniref:chaplin family protein n=1 Tax=Streptomyces sp. NPDC088810 TaxID=3365904 RepID=UPI00382C955E